MSATANPPSGKPAPRPPGAAVPRSPRPPKQSGGDLEPPSTKAQISRRHLAWLGLTAFFTIVAGGAVYFFFPRTIREKKTKFKVGYPSDYGVGVSTAFQNQYRVWVVRDVEKIFVIYAQCTHLGCTPEWKDSERKFKCPCHGSGYDADGINFEGPAPRPMDRCGVTIAPDGQILVDTQIRLLESQWGQPNAFIPV